MPTRYDVTQIRATKTDEGFILDKPIIGRSGLLRYMNADGTERIEYRPPEEAFDEQSLASIRGKPIMIGHAAMADANNVDGLPVVGSVLTKGEQDGDNIRADVSIFKLPTDARDLSCGYKLELDQTPGITPDGKHYDAVQRKIRYNHLAIVPRGRAGVARLNMDGDQCFDDDGSGLTADQLKKIPDSMFGLPDKRAYPMPDKSHAGNAKARAAQMLKTGMLTQAEYDQIVAKANKILSQRGDGEMEKVRLDSGIEYEVPPEVKAYLDKHRNDAADQKKNLDTLQAKFDSLSASSEKFKTDTEKEKKELSEKFDAAVSKRMDLLDIARKHKIEKAETLKDGEIKTAVIKAVNGDGFDLKDKSDEYINAAFDMCKLATKRTDDTTVSNRLKVYGGAAHLDDKENVDEWDYVEKEKKLRDAEANAYLGGAK